MQSSRRLAYGFWRYQEHEIETALTMLERVRALGIDHLDTADIYGGHASFGGAERLVGVLRGRATSLFEGATLATKAGVEPGAPYNSSEIYLRRACDESLKRLGVERIDLFYVHRPDLLTHPADLAATLDRLFAEGKIGAIGVSNFSPHQIDALTNHMKAPLSATQVEFSAAHVEPILDGSLDQAMRESFGVYAWSPLAGGRLMERGAGLDPVRTTITEVARAREAPFEATALAFVLSHPAGAIPIVGTKSAERLAACAQARTLVLERAEWYAILEARLGRRLP
jgi:predicted oxidoreductase